MASALVPLSNFLLWVPFSRQQGWQSRWTTVGQLEEALMGIYEGRRNHCGTPHYPLTTKNFFCLFNMVIEVAVPPPQEIFSTGPPLYVYLLGLDNLSQWLTNLLFSNKNGSHSSCFSVSNVFKPFSLLYYQVKAKNCDLFGYPITLTFLLRGIYPPILSFATLSYFILEQGISAISQLTSETVHL